MDKHIPRSADSSTSAEVSYLLVASRIKTWMVRLVSRIDWSSRMSEIPFQQGIESQKLRRSLVEPSIWANVSVLEFQKINDERTRKATKTLLPGAYAGSRIPIATGTAQDSTAAAWQVSTPLRIG